MVGLPFERQACNPDLDASIGRADQYHVRSNGTSGPFALGVF